MKRKVFFTGILSLLGIFACGPLVVDEYSAFALASGNMNIIFGASCGLPLDQGHQACSIERGKPMPTLTIYFMNPGSYGVSDCKFGLFKTGSVNGPTSVTIDLAPLSDQVNQDGFCVLKIEATENYPDPKDPHQTREIALGGIFFIEALAPGYNPHPPKNLMGWCARIGLTTKGRRYVKVLDPEDCD